MISLPSLKLFSSGLNGSVKSLLHVATVVNEVSHLVDLDVDFGAPVVNIDTLRVHNEKAIIKLTGGLAAMVKMRKVTIMRGYGAFVGASHVSWTAPARWR